MARRVGSANFDSLRIAGGLRETVPTVSDGLIKHYNFEKGITEIRSPRDLKALVMGISYNDVIPCTETLDTMGIEYDEYIMDYPDVMHKFNNIVESGTYIKYDIIFYLNGNRAVYCSNKHIDTILKAGIHLITSGNESISSHIKYIGSTVAADDTTEGVGGNDPLYICENPIGDFDGTIPMCTPDSFKFIIKTLNDGAKPLFTYVNTEGISSFYVDKYNGLYVHFQEKLRDREAFVFKYIIEYVCRIPHMLEYEELEGGVFTEHGLSCVNYNYANLYGGEPLSGNIDYEIIDNEFPNCPFSLNSSKILKLNPTGDKDISGIGAFCRLYGGEGLKGTYTISMWVYVENGYVSDSDDSPHIVTIPNVFNINIDSFGEWQYITQTYELDIADGEYFNLYVYGQYHPGKWLKGNIYVANVTIRKTYADLDYREYGDRPKDLELPISIKNSGDWTMVLSTENMYNFAEYSKSGPLYTYNTISISSNTIGYNHMSLAQWYNDCNDPNWRIVGNTDTKFNLHVGPTFREKGETATFFISKCDGILSTGSKLASGKYNKYTYNTSELVNFDDDIIFKSIRFNNNSNIYYKDLYIFDKALTEEEFMSIANDKKSFSIDNDGNLNTKSVIEKPLIPNDAIYFPLSEDTKDYDGLIEPTVEKNVVFDKGIMTLCDEDPEEIEIIPRVDSGFKEIESDNDGECWFEVDTDMEGDRRTIKMLHIPDDDLLKYKGRRVVISYDYYYDIPCGMKLEYDCNLHTDDSINNDSGYYDSVLVNTLLREHPKKWTTAMIEYTIVNSEDIRNSHDCLYNWNQPCPSGGMIKLRNVRCYIMGNGKSDRNLPTCEIKNSDLRYNLHDTAGLDWSKDWTIMFNKLPLEDMMKSNTSVNDYCIDSIGVGSGSDYLWFGFLGNKVRLDSRPLSTGEFKGNSTYRNDILRYGEWYTTVLSYNYESKLLTYDCIATDGRSIHLEVDDIVLEGKDATVYANNDFIMNGFMSGMRIYNSKAQYRDLVVLKRLVTDEEVKDFAKTTLRATKDGLNINGFLKEDYDFGDGE